MSGYLKRKVIVPNIKVNLVTNRYNLKTNNKFI